MDERIRDPIGSTLYFLILNTVREAPLDGLAIDHRIQRVRGMLDIAASRKGLPGPTATIAALRQLEHAGWLEAKYAQSGSDHEKLYALTREGRQRLDLEWAARSSALTNFVESGSLDDSFRRFLNRDM